MQALQNLNERVGGIEQMAGVEPPAEGGAPQQEQPPHSNINKKNYGRDTSYGGP